MSRFQQIDNGNYMGDATKKEARGPKDATPKGGTFERGVSKLPGRDDNFPKNGKNLAPSFQNLREQDPAKGKI